MTSRIRFADAADVFDAYPRLALTVPPPDGPIEPLEHARALAASARPVAALVFLAHVLPRREAVWWGCQCVSAMSGAEKDEGLRLAIEWVRDPDEVLRRAALVHAEANGLRTPGSWLARAAGYSGGSVLEPEQPATPPQQDACAMAVNAAVVTAATTAPLLTILPWMRACAEAGVRFAAGEEARVLPPVAPRPTATL